ncbi:MAG TPA: DsbA family protein [Rickettsiales bacterium]|nr:DsbA family protein [Rickettsiales bacterium]
MSFNTNFSNGNLVKPIGIIVVVLLIIGGAYSFFGKKSDDNSNEVAKINASGLDQDQKIRNVGDVEEVLAKWVANNPQAILDSVANMQRKAIEEQLKNAQKNIGTKKSELFDSKSPSYTPSGYDVTIVEFFDYNCGYCKRVSPTIEKLLGSDKKLRIIYKEFPILGQSSEDISTVALAVHLMSPSSYRKFHNALMSSNASTKTEALAIAKNVGLDVDKIKQTLSSKKDSISQIINNNRILGSEIGIQGTPGFVIGDELIPGAVELETLKAKIAQERKK